MNNGINMRQNEENSILLLAAQRQLYNEAKIVEKMLVLFSVFFPLLLVVVQIFIKTNIALNTIVYITSIVSMFIGIYVKKYVDEKKN